jgi:large subunit ribosomal protein L24
MARIRRGDTVAVLSGKDKGKTGKVLQVWPDRDRALVERINLVKHFERRSQQSPAGGVVEREGSIALSKLAPWCPKCRRAARVATVTSAGADKQRTCRRCGETLSAAA